MARQVITVAQKLARLASRSHGVVTRKQLLRAGISVDQIRQRVENGSLIPVHRGVYRVGHWAPSVEATYIAAVLACGERAVLSGRAAGYLWGLLKGPAPDPEVAARTVRRVHGVRTRRSNRIARGDRTMWRGIPVTTVACTLVDLAADLSLDDLARASHEAGVRHRTTPRQVEAVLARRPRSPGAGKLNLILRGDARVTLSKLEKRFLKLVSGTGLPLPQTNRPAGGRRVDCRWPEFRLTVELDSYTFHQSRHAWERDRRREREAYARGDSFRRYTYDDVFDRPAIVLVELRPLLSTPFLAS